MKMMWPSSLLSPFGYFFPAEAGKGDEGGFMEGDFKNKCFLMINNGVAYDL